MTTASVVSEQKFSTIGFIRSKQRNCLTAQNDEKLTTIKNLWAALYNYVPLNESADVADDFGSKPIKQEPARGITGKCILFQDKPYGVIDLKKLGFIE